MSGAFSPEFYDTIGKPLSPIERVRPRKLLSDNERLRLMFEETVSGLYEVVRPQLREEKHVLGNIMICLGIPGEPESEGEYGLTKNCGQIGFFHGAPDSFRWPYKPSGFVCRLAAGQTGAKLLPEQYEQDLKAFLVGSTGSKSCFVNDMFGRYHI